MPFDLAGGEEPQAPLRGGRGGQSVLRPLGLLVWNGPRQGTRMELRGGQCPSGWAGEGQL